MGNYYLTKEDAKAIRLADSVCFHLTKETAESDTLAAVCRITLSKEIKTGSDVFPGSNERMTAQRFITTRAHLPRGASKAFASLWDGENGAWGLIRRTIREGDEVTFSARENGNQYVKAAKINSGDLENHDCGYDSLHSDELLVSVYRKGSSIASCVVIAHSTCPNNTARMIQTA